MLTFSTLFPRGEIETPRGKLFRERGGGSGGPNNAHTKQRGAPAMDNIYVHEKIGTSLIMKAALRKARKAGSQLGGSTFPWEDKE